MSSKPVKNKSELHERAHLSGDDSNLWDGCFCIRIQKFGTMTDDTTMLLMCSYSVGKVTVISRQRPQREGGGNQQVRGLCPAFSVIEGVIATSVGWMDGWMDGWTDGLID